MEEAAIVGLMVCDNFILNHENLSCCDYQGIPEK
jgi:hypothetical protein